MDSTTVLSIIVPVYNTSSYLEECINSLVNNTVSGYEIIIVNDGSTDDSLLICEKFKNKNQNIIKIFSKPNGGLSSARNYGISKASGKYIIFVDSDDYLYPGSIDVFFKYLNKYEDIDAFEFGYGTFVGDDLKFETKPLLGLFNTDDYLSSILQESNYKWYAWKYVFNKTLFNQNLLFPEGLNYEDIWLIPRLLLNSKTIVGMDFVAYHYRLGRAGAITASLNLNNELNKLSVIDNVISFIESREKTVSKEYILSNLSNEYYSALISLYMFKNKDRKILFAELKNKKNLTKYTKSNPQLLVKRIMKIFGLKITAFLLFVRERLKK